MVNRAAFALLSVFALPVAADVYRCELQDGRVVYQDAGCPVGTRQKAIIGEALKAELAQAARKKEQDRKADKK